MRPRGRRRLYALVSAVATLGILGVVDCEVGHSYPGATRSAVYDDGVDPRADQDRAPSPAAHDEKIGHTDHAHVKVSKESAQRVRLDTVVDGNGASTRRSSKRPNACSACRGEGRELALFAPPFAVMLLLRVRNLLSTDYLYAVCVRLRHHRRRSCHSQMASTTT